MPVALIYGNERKLVFELITKAKDLGYEAAVAALGESVENPDEFIHRGADKVFVVEDANLKNGVVDTTATTLEQVVKEAGANHVWITGSRHGKELAPYLAAKLDAGMVTFAVKVEEQDGKLAFDRMYMGGKVIATEIPESDVVVATFGTRLWEPLDADTGRSGDVKKLDVDVPEPKVKVVEVKERETSGVNLEDATLVVGIGRGVKNKEDMKIAFDLAEAIGGQVGCTRPLATDLGWLTDEYWIGLSGKEVKPDLYLAAGISGQIQHTTGIRGSKVIVAVNTNKDAPIFKQADYGIVGDLYKVLPAFQSAVQKELGK